MAIEAYMIFKDHDGSYLQSESQVVLQGNIGIPEASEFAKALNGIFEIEDYSLDIEQVVNIGNQGGGGAGKVTFNPFSITRKLDKASPIFLQRACSGTAFQEVFLGFRKSAGGAKAALFFVVFHFKLVAIKSINWSHGDESPKEALTFEYGGLQIFYGQQAQSGAMMKTVAGGWNRVQNKVDTDISAVVQ